MKSRRHYILITIVITLYLLTSCSSPAAGETPVKHSSPEAVSAEIARANELFRDRRNVDSLREAVRSIGRLRDPSVRNFEVEWQFSRFSYFLGKQTRDESEAEAVLLKGKEAGIIASRLEPNRPEGHFWYAANLGELASLSPITVGIKSVDEIRAAMIRVTELQPDYQHASAFDALGQLEMKTRLYGGKAEKAVEYFESGLAVSTTNPNLRVNLAEAYLAVKRDRDARGQIQELFRLEPDPLFVIEHETATAKAKRLLETSF